MKNKYIIPVLCFLITCVSCVSSKKYQESVANYSELKGAYLDLKSKYNTAQEQANECALKLRNSAAQTQELGEQNIQLKTDYKAQIADLNSQIDYLKKNNNQVLNQLTEMSVVTKAQAESIQKSIDNISSKDSYIQGLQASIARKDSMNMNLVMNLKGAIGNLDDKDINIKVEKSLVYIDISDKLLFKSGSYIVNPGADIVLGKIAQVLKAQPAIEFMVEGHTDNVPFKGNAILTDNWDLSVMRATSIVKILQKKYGINPVRMTAAGRSYYAAIANNNTAEGKAINRRTRIVILPQLDQFFHLLERKPE